MLFYTYMPMLLCDCQSFIKASYLLTYFTIYIYILSILTNVREDWRRQRRVVKQDFD